ncbi:MAG: ATP-binding cassette domain-containing protein [Armatimonadaceae bacterium]
MPMVEIRGVTKVYGSLVALHELNLTLEPGEIFGFIGPNGAGKTTTIKILATLLEPSTGKAFVDGIDVTADPEAVRAVIGYMPDSFGVYDDFKVWEYLDFFAAAYKVPKVDRPGLVDMVLELTNLTVKKDAWVESLSRGMKQRLCLARTLVHNPKLLLLDEPASGLDPRARIELREMLRELRSMGKTIVVSSHILPELADFCTNVGIIEKGVLKVAGPIGDVLGSRRSVRRLEIQPADTDRATARLVLASNADVANVDDKSDVWVVDLAGDLDSQSQLMRELLDAGVRLHRFAEKTDNLEDLFLSVTEGVVS